MNFSTQSTFNIEKYEEIANSLTAIGSIYIDNEIILHKSLFDESKVEIANTFLHLNSPEEWYPEARLMKRKVILHVGPTNSGKTYNALQRLRQAQKKFGGGIYCGPLRLLAQEIYMKLNSDGISCNLSTGQEKVEIPFAHHVACTVEMLDVMKCFDVAIIDEIQFIAEPQRGFNWTRALLGLKAREIHLCGGSEAVTLVKKILANTTDELEVIEYNRLLPLEVETSALMSYENVQSGDCIVAFSYQNLFQIKTEIETKTKFKCAIIFGSLPPSLRAQQANLFNNRTDGYEILVATDAIGYGLNLNIRRVVFHTLIKTNALLIWEAISFTAIKQIAGRAGRLSSAYPKGYVTTFKQEDICFVKLSLETSIPDLTAAGVVPSFESFEKYFEYFILQPESQDTSYDSVIKFLEFIESLKVSAKYENFFFLPPESFLGNLRMLADLNLTVKCRFRIATLPTSLNFIFSPLVTCFKSYITKFSEGRLVPFGIRQHNAPVIFNGGSDDLSLVYSLTEIYIWLAQNFPAHFFEIEFAKELQSTVLKEIGKALSNIFAGKKVDFDKEDYQRRMGLFRSFDPETRNSMHPALKQLVSVRSNTYTIKLQ